MNDVAPEPAEGTPSTTEAPPKKGSPLWGCLGLAVLVIGLPVACAIASSGGGSSWEPTAFEARSICEDWVRDKLKAPATADFTDGDETGGPTAYTITGTVDAENSFGAMLRTTWSCDIEYRASDEQWHGNATLDE